MKKLRIVRLLLLCFTAAFIAACSNNGDGVKDLKLSAANECVYTDSLTYSFDVLSYNGEYKVSMDNGKASVKDSHVIVDLLRPTTYLTVTDASGQSVKLTIVSNNSSLVQMTTSVGVAYGNYFRSKLNWGNGGYYITSISGDAASLVLDKDGSYTVIGKRPGNQLFEISDARGTTNYMEVNIYDGYDITSDTLKVTLSNPGTYTFPIKYGKNDWSIASCTQALKNAQTLIMDKNEMRENDLLQIHIPSGTKGIVTLTLKDEDNNKVVIDLNVIQ